jgi:hypothetical protein
MADHSSVSARRSTKPRRPNIRLYGYMIDHANYVRCARQRPVYTEMRGHGDPHTQPPRGPWTEMIIYEAHMEAYQSCIRRCPKFYAAPSARSPRPPFSTISATSESVVVFSRVYRESTPNGGVEHSRRSAHR